MKSQKDSAIFFVNETAFREWLEKNHKKESELIVAYYKIGTKKPSMTWSQSVDQALCFGWIDGIRKTIDEESYSIRFTPRRSNSIWSAINIKKVEALIEAGLMKPEGLQAFELRNENKSRIYSHETENVELAPTLQKLFKKNKKAWSFFEAQTASYKKRIIHWIMSAVQEKTKNTRLEKVIQQSEQGLRILA